MSLLLDHGHPTARDYPISMVWDEVEFIVARQNRMEATGAILIQSAVSSILSEKGGSHFKKLIKKMMQDE